MVILVHDINVRRKCHHVNFRTRRKYACFRFDTQTIHTLPYLISNNVGLLGGVFDLNKSFEKNTCNKCVLFILKCTYTRKLIYGHFIKRKHNENHPTLAHYFGISKSSQVLFFCPWSSNQ